MAFEFELGGYFRVCFGCKSGKKRNNPNFNFISSFFCVVNQKFDIITIFNS